MPIPLGVLAVAGAGAGPVVAGNAYEWLETQVLGTAVASISFSNLNTNYGSTYQHLQIRMVARSDEVGSGNLRDLRIRTNGDTAGNYAAHVLRGDGAAVSSNAASSQTSVATAMALFPRPDNGTNQYGAAIIDFLDAFETTKYKTIRVLGGAKPTGEDQIFLGSGLWQNSNALTSITLFANSGNLAVDSRFSLYGLRSA